MKYHFIYPDVGTGYYPSVHHGLAQLIAVLKTNGQDASLHHVKKEPKRDDIVSLVKKESPDIVGFTTMSNQVNYVKLWSGWIKEKYKIPIVCGGVYATLCPEELLSIPSIDMVCVGEGERSIIDRHFWVKQNGCVVKSMPYPLVESLDELPFPDYSLFDCENMIKARGGNFAVIVSRGCAMSCTYCCNGALRERQKGLGKYFRYRSVDNTLALLEHYISQYFIKSFSFADDIFGLNKEWVFEFCKKYPKAIGLPFGCNLRVESATLEVLGALKRANCVEVEMGIEAGNEWIRSDILNRKMSNQQIIDAFDNAHKLGMKTRSYNMIGLPYETPEMVRETLGLNKRINPDDVAVFYFYPYKGTQLYDVCEREGFMSDKQSTGYVKESVLKLSTINAKELSRLHTEFSRYAAKRQTQSYGVAVRLFLEVACGLLRLLTCGNEVKVLRMIYMKLFPLFQRLRKD